MAETAMPTPGSSTVACPNICSTARTASPIAESEISTTWNIAASASALPWPKRWLASLGMAAIHTPISVARLATRSSPVSARLPSIASDPVESTA